MYGSFRGQSPLPEPLEAELRINGEVKGRIAVATAATPVHDKVILVQKNKLPAADYISLVLDGTEYVMEREDKLTGNVIFAPVLEPICNFPTGNGLDG